MVLVQKWAFFQLFFQAIQFKKMSFMIFQNEKTPFQATKTRSSKSQKIDIFPKGLAHGFGPKKAIFPPFFFRQYRPGKCLLRYSKAKKRPFQAKKTRRLKRVNPWFCSKSGYFSNFFFRQYKLGKCLLWYSRTIKRLSRL